ncbi:hypothetical protein CYY_004910 [Polysphondylium violaceum]|uniref:Acyl-coenzyme A oxidase n=1 Tax=Polysphondylium violaceum TaxID=133409 RepID=A0A8J4PUL8_9MYCE|nr:hypothetical protein CYY_004910 [Polysphondylium violaceum]
MYNRNQLKNNKDINPILVEERSKASFSVDAMHLILNQFDQSKIELKNKLYKELELDQEISSPENLFFLSREDQFKRALRISKKVIEIKNKLQIENPLIFHQTLYQEIPLMLHDCVFLNALKSLASEEQLKYWGPLFSSYQLFGSYSQTELGHGSNVQMLETQAIYRPESDEFELISPTLTSTKWWIGGLGVVSTHTIVFAQLYIQTKNDTKPIHYGPHAFLVPIRCLKTQKLLPGIICGDIGPKFGFACVDNGFLRLDKVRIPRANMLQRFAKVEKGGNYIKPSHSRLIYAGMVGVRTLLIEDSFSGISRALTIATRYSVIRRQFKSSPKDTIENQVMDYGNQQYRIIPYIAQAYALFFTGKEFTSSFQKMMTNIKEKNDLSLLAELHSNSSGLKSVITYATNEAIENCRLACGGHGYSHISGFPMLQANYSHVMTAEGENNILPQQTAKFLLSQLQRVITSEGDVPLTLGKSIQYLLDEHKSQVSNIHEFIAKHSLSGLTHPAALVQLFKHRAYFLLTRLMENMQEAGSSGAPLMQIWSDFNVQINQASKAHCQLYIIDCFYRSINSINDYKSGKPEFGPIHSILSKLFQIYCLFLIDKDMSDFIQDNQYLPISDIETIRKELYQLLKVVRPDVVSLVDAFDLPDYTIGSYLGRYDGNVYENMWNWASKQNPMNQRPFLDSLDFFFKPLVNSNL